MATATFGNNGGALSTATFGNNGGVLSTATFGNNGGALLGHATIRVIVIIWTSGSLVEAFQDGLDVGERGTGVWITRPARPDYLVVPETDGIPCRILRCRKFQIGPSPLLINVDVKYSDLLTPPTHTHLGLTKTRIPEDTYHYISTVWGVCVSM